MGLKTHDKRRASSHTERMRVRKIVSFMAVFGALCAPSFAYQTTRFGGVWQNTPTDTQNRESQGINQARARISAVVVGAHERFFSQTSGPGWNNSIFSSNSRVTMQRIRAQLLRVYPPAIVERIIAQAYEIARERERRGRGRVDPATLAMLVGEVIRAESNGYANARSHAGALGLMQVMPPTARAMGIRGSLFDPRVNIAAGMHYLMFLWDTFSGGMDMTSADSDEFSIDLLSKVLAAYNAGPGAVRRYLGIPPYRETIKYVWKILGSFQRHLVALV